MHVRENRSDPSHSPRKQRWVKAGNAWLAWGPKGHLLSLAQVGAPPASLGFALRKVWGARLTGLECKEAIAGTAVATILMSCVKLHQKLLPQDRKGTGKIWASSRQGSGPRLATRWALGNRHCVGKTGIWEQSVWSQVTPLWMNPLWKATQAALVSAHVWSPFLVILVEEGPLPMPWPPAYAFHRMVQEQCCQNQVEELFCASGINLASEQEDCAVTQADNSSLEAMVVKVRVPPEAGISLSSSSSCSHGWSSESGPFILFICLFVIVLVYFESNLGALRGSSSGLVLRNYS